MKLRQTAIFIGFLIIFLMATVQILVAQTIEQRAGTDLSLQYEQIMQSDIQSFSEHTVNIMQSYKVLLIPGFLADFFEKDRDRLFLKQVRWLESMGMRKELDFKRLTYLDSEAHPTINAKYIAMEIEQSKRPVIIISHSKGSLDTLHALTDRADLRANVRGWISIQGAMHGSPVADYLYFSPHRWFFSFLLSISGGSIDTLAALTENNVNNFLQERDHEIKRLNAEVPIISLGTWATKFSQKLKWGLMLYKSALEGKKHDGLIPTENELLPYSDYVIAENIDHTEPLLDLDDKFDEIKLTQTLLLLLFSR